MQTDENNTNHCVAPSDKPRKPRQGIPLEHQHTQELFKRPRATGHAEWRYFANIEVEQLNLNAVRFFASTPITELFWMDFDKEHQGIEKLKAIKSKILDIIQLNLDEDWAARLAYQPRTLPKFVPTLFSPASVATIDHQSILFHLLNRGTKHYTSGMHPIARPTNSMEKLFTLLNEQLRIKTAKQSQPEL